MIRKETSYRYKIKSWRNGRKRGRKEETHSSNFSESGLEVARINTVAQAGNVEIVARVMLPIPASTIIPFHQHLETDGTYQNIITYPLSFFSLCAPGLLLLLERRGGSRGGDERAPPFALPFPAHDGSSVAIALPPLTSPASFGMLIPVFEGAIS